MQQLSLKVASVPVCHVQSPSQQSCAGCLGHVAFRAPFSPCRIPVWDSVRWLALSLFYLHFHILLGLVAWSFSCAIFLPSLVWLCSQWLTSAINCRFWSAFHLWDEGEGSRAKQIPLPDLACPCSWGIPQWSVSVNISVAYVCVYC